MYNTALSDQMNAALATYLRYGFDIWTKSRLDKEVHGNDGEITDKDCAATAIQEGLLEADEVRLTPRGFRYLCRLKS